MDQLITDDSYKFLCLKYFDYILEKESVIKKEQIVERIRELRDILDRF